MDQSVDDNSEHGNKNSIREDIKKRALEALVPLVEQLEDAPERKFEILMTAVRTSEEESLLGNALDAAIQIEDPAAKADALLDVINEASYQQQK